MSLKNKVAIVGADETDRIGIVPDMTPIMMHAEAARNALNFRPWHRTAVNP